jgi:P-type Ca2+ transporter type 2A
MAEVLVAEVIRTVFHFLVLVQGTVITVGRARAVVTGTGPSTAIGKIRDAMVEAPEDVTPLKQKLDEFGSFLSKVSVLV